MILCVQQAGVGSNTSPVAILIKPGVGEPPPVVEGLVLIGSLRVIFSDDNGYIRVRNHLHVLAGDKRKLVRGISVVP